MSCNKISFTNKLDAKNFANGKKEHSRNNPMSNKIQFYLCSECKSWHITSMSKKEIRSIKNKIKAYGIKSGQLWEDYKGRTIEVIKPPTNYSEINLWLLNFKLVREG